MKEYEKAIEAYNACVASGGCTGGGAWRDFIPFVLNEIGVLNARGGNLEDAVTAFDKAIGILDASLQNLPNGSVCFYRTACLLVETKKHMATALMSGGAIDEACRLFEELSETFRDGPYANEVLLSDCAYHSASLLNSQGKYESAEPYIRACVEIRRKLFGARVCDSQNNHNNNEKEAVSSSSSSSPSSASTSLSSSAAHAAAMSACMTVEAKQQNKRCEEYKSGASCPSSSSTTSSKGSGCDPARRFASESAAEIAVALCLLAATIASPAIAKYDEAEECIREAIQITHECPEAFANKCRASEVERMKSILASIIAARSTFYKLSQAQDSLAQAQAQAQAQVEMEMEMEMATMGERDEEGDGYCYTTQDTCDDNNDANGGDNMMSNN